MDKPEEREVLVPLRPKTDFEKLLFVRAVVEELKKLIKKKDVEIGELKSYIEELKYKPNDKPLTSDERIKLQKDQILSQYKKMVKKRHKEKIALMQTNKELLKENMKLKKQLDDKQTE